MRNGVTEQELKEKATGERVTLEQVEAAIINEKFLQEGLMTLCVLGLWNGYSVLGKSACADPNNFNEEIGRRLARQDAINQIWPLMGYELKCRLQRAGQAERPEGAQRPTGNAEGAGTASEENKDKTEVIGQVLRSHSDEHRITTLAMKLDLGGKPHGFYVEYTDEARDSDNFDVERETLRDLLHGMRDLVRATDPVKHSEDAVMLWGTWLDRAKLELEQLTTSYDKLYAFTLSDEFSALPALDRQDLHTQCYHMEGYKRSLERRVARHGQ